MAIKKSELYSSLWASCDKLRGSMEPSEYKDYVLVLLFMKYVSDKYANDPDGLIIIPEGGGFKDLQQLKGSKDIGEKMDVVISILAEKNDLEKVIDVVEFQDEEKLGKGKEMVDKLTDLITIFENPALDFSKNHAGGDDILGDAYEYLMRNFASDSGKSKGEFYTPGEVSRVLAKVIGIKKGTNNKPTVYDPTCGSGSLLLKVADEVDNRANLYGQEKTVVTAALARMNVILHNNEDAEIKKGQSTLSNPLFTKEGGNLQTFDFVVANPPFSSKNWTDGFDPSNDIYERFEAGKIPTEKNGDYAFLLHIIKSLKATGKGACILPHGVLFRGNVEAEIRKSIIEQGYIKGIIGLPANLFYGTGIPACVIVLDMENAAASQDLTDEERGLFMLDASKGFMKDGNKNRLREQDIHKIVDIFTKQTEVPKFSRFVSYKEISDPKNDFNLNIPRYIDSQEAEDTQDIEAHLLGGIPNADIEILRGYWQVYPNLKKQLFADSSRLNYSQLIVPKETIKQTIFSNAEFVQFSATMDNLFLDWKTRNTLILKTVGEVSNLPDGKNLSNLPDGKNLSNLPDGKNLSNLPDGKNLSNLPKQTIHNLSEDALSTYTDKPLIDKYDVYQHVMNYWNDTMQDDCYLIAADGWVAEPYRVIVTNPKTKKETDKGWACDLVPKGLVVNRYFAAEQKAIDALEGQKETLLAQITEYEEEHGGEESFFTPNNPMNKVNAQKRLKAIDTTPLSKKKDAEEISVLKAYLKMVDELTDLNKQIREATQELDKLAFGQYKKLKTDDIKQLAVDDKWMATLERSVKTEMERISQRLTQRIKELAERYETPLPKQTKDVAGLEEKVAAHLRKMGFKWADTEGVV